jgi:rubrerythrin
MMDLTSFENVLDFAIQNEIEARDMYLKLAEGSEVPAIKTVFEQFAREEDGHRIKLESIKGGASPLPLDTNIQDLKIGDFLVKVEPKPDMDYQETLIFAMKKEKEAFRLYTTLADFTDDPTLKDTFYGLAQEEAKHKLRFEVEYDDNILTEN